MTDVPASRIPQFTSLTLATLMVVALGWQTYLFTKEFRSKGNPEVLKELPSLSNSSLAKKEGSLSSNQVLNDLFGSAKVESEKVEIKQQENIPETKLKLTLRGVSVSLSPEKRSALIEGPDRETNVYNINAQLPGNATLHEVHADRVIIQRNGLLEKVFFPREADPNAAVIAQTSRDIEPDEVPVEYTPEYIAPAEPVEPMVQAQEEVTEQEAPEGGISEDRKEEIKKRLKELRERMQVQ